MLCCRMQKIYPLLLLLILIHRPLLAEAPRPNIVFIISDDQSWTDYGFMGHAQIRTPHLDQLARQSLVFRRGYVCSSLCCPSLASLLTGKYSHQTKITGNEPPRPKGAGVNAYKDPAFRAQLQQLNDEVGSDRSLLVLCTAFRGRGDYPNITVKKIPKQVLSRCEWGHDDYSLQVENLPKAPPKAGQQDLDLA